MAVNSLQQGGCDLHTVQVYKCATVQELKWSVKFTHTDCMTVKTEDLLLCICVFVVYITV